MMTKAVTLSLGSFTPKCSKFSIEANNPVEPREDISDEAPEAIGYYYVGAPRKYTLGLDPEAEAVGTWDVHGLWKARTEGAFELVLSDGDVEVTIAAPKVQLLPPQEGERGSKFIHEIEAQCNMDEGDDEISITAAAAA